LGVLEAAQKQNANQDVAKVPSLQMEADRKAKKQKSSEDLEDLSPDEHNAVLLDVAEQRRQKVEGKVAELQKRQKQAHAKKMRAQQKEADLMQQVSTSSASVEFLPSAGRTGKQSKDRQALLFIGMTQGVAYPGFQEDAQEQGTRT
jgi:hypothetical protein